LLESEQQEFIDVRGEAAGRLRRFKAGADAGEAGGAGRRQSGHRGRLEKVEGKENRLHAR